MLYRLAISGILALLLAVLSVSAIGDRLEREIGLPVYYAVRGDRPVPDHALIVSIDNKSIGWLQRNVHGLDDISVGLTGCLTPHARQMLEQARNINHVPRALYVCLLNKLIAANAAYIVFDINFNAEKPDDDAFADAIRRAANVLLFERVGNDSFAAGDETHDFSMRVQPAEPLRQAAAGTVGFKVDGSSNTMVTGYLTGFADFPDLPAMPIETWRRVVNVDKPEAFEPPNLRPIWLYGPAGTLQTVSLREVFDRRSTTGLPADLSGTILFVGASEPSIEAPDDQFRVPLFVSGGGIMRGVELAATAFLNLMENHHLYRASEIVTALIVLVFSFAVFSGALLLPASYKLVGAIAVAGAYFLAAVLLFNLGRVWIPFAWPIAVATPAAAAIALSSRYLVARRLLERLAPHQFVERILRRTKVDRGQGELERSTMVFMDMIGSTKLAGRMGVQRYGEVSNIYYDRAGDLIEAHGGMVVRFEGDGIFALFTESVAGETHAARACRAALAISEALKQADIQSAVGDPRGLRLRIGITTGMILTGLVGAHDRQNVDALGQSVNIAKRLEQMGKSVERKGADVILISEETRTEAGLKDEQVERIGSMPVRGLEKDMIVFRLRSI